MKKIKDFCTEHKRVLIQVGMITCAVLVGAAVGGIVYDTKKHNDALRSVAKNNAKKIELDDAIRANLSLDTAKEFMDNNKDTTGGFALFRETLDPTSYALVILGDTKDVILKGGVINE